MGAGSGKKYKKSRKTAEPNPYVSWHFPWIPVLLIGDN
jgi:hypothetical protein